MCVDVPVLESSGALESFGDLLRHWRKLRGCSQLSLALEAGSSARHISFVESGRARPSRAMVLRLAEALRLSLRDQNLLLGGAGFAPAYPESPLDSAALERARMALELMLAKQEPYPALIMNRSWEVIMTNQATGRLFGLLDLDSQALGQGFNALRSFLHPQGLKRFIRNWPIAAGMTLARLQRDLALTLDPALFALMEEVKTYPGVRSRAAAGNRARRAGLVLVHHHRQLRHAPGRDSAGAEGGAVLSDGRGDRGGSSAAPRLTSPTSPSSG